MSFPRYERYKDSDVDWLGEVPEHWQMRRMKTLFEIKKRIAGEIGYDILSITQNGIKIKDTESNEGQVAMDYAYYQFVYPGDFAMNHMDLLTGYIDISKVEGVTSPDYRVFSIRKATACHPSYFLRLFQNAYHQKIFYAFGQGASQFGRWRLPTKAFNEFALPYPPLTDQVLIGHFLDRETTKIDALIEEQQRLIELLKEKRQAVISHAVTKGLNPDAKKRDAGLKWIGKIPASWTATRVKYAVSHIVDCLHTTPTYDGELLFPAIRTADVEPGRLLLRQTRLVSEEVYLERVQRLEPQADDILYSREGERFGMAALVPPDTRVCLGQRMMMFRPDPSFDPGYLMWALNSSAVYQQVLEGITGPTAPHVNIGLVINFVIPAPHLTEQREISRHIDTTVNRMDDLVARAQDGIELLEERRFALISAAVTGKIDVRNYTPKEAA